MRIHFIPMRSVKICLTVSESLNLCTLFGRQFGSVLELRGTHLVTRAVVLLGPCPADTSAEMHVCSLEDSCWSELFVVAGESLMPDGDHVSDSTATRTATTETWVGGPPQE